MYLPKSQIKESKFTNGDEFVRGDNGQPYKGFYWQDSSGKYYTGKTPQDFPVVEIVLDISDSDESESPTGNNVSWATDYNPKITSTKPGKVPSKYFPSPTDDDYSVGEFQRYFTKKANQNLYFEISKKEYKDLKSQSNTVLWHLYEPITLPWQISGTKQEVFTTNRNIVLETERNQKLPGFRKIFRKDYLQYYKD